MDKPPPVSGRMQALIALIVMFDFSGMLFFPSLFPGWKEPSDALQQILFAIVMLAVGYYLGSSQGSAKKDENAAAILAANVQPLGSVPTGKPEDPVSVSEVPSDPKGPK